MQTRHYLNGLGMTVLRPLAAGIALAVIGFAAPHASFADDNALTITSWGGTFQDMEQLTFFDPFTKETGIKVNQDNWDGELSKIRAMVDTGNVTWDLVVADYGHAIAGCAEGILEPIDYSKLGNVDDFLPGTTHKCGISSDIYSLMFGYNAEKMPEGPKTIADAFDVKKFPGKRGLRKQPKYLLEHALMADGVAPADVYKVLDTPEGVDRAFKKLDTIKSDIIWWDSNAQAAQLLASGEVAIAEIYNGRLYDIQTKAKGKFIPIWDGQVYAPDTWIIPKGANTEAAYKFLSFMVQPKILADFSSKIPYAPARKSSIDFVAPEMKSFMPTAPENFKNAVSSNEEWWADHEEALRERFEKWLAQ